MSRVLAVAVGIPALVPARHHAGPGMRAAHFATALARAGHEVLLLCIQPEDAALPVSLEVEVAGGTAPRCVFVRERQITDADVRGQMERFAPDALVGVTAYAASVATRLGTTLPMWADIFGDLMAEAQAKAVLVGNDAPLVHFWKLLGPVLERADRFSAVSGAQARALVGQLGLAGRLSAATAGERLVEVIPCAAEPRADDGDGGRALRGEVVPADAFVVLWSGGFNTWCDVETLVEGVARAMRADPRVHLVATGAAIRGHDERTFERFRELVAGSRVAERFHLLGWVESSCLARVYSEADVGVHVERDLYERELGGENRVVEWLAHGVPCVTTARSELGRSLVRRGLALHATPGDPDALAATLLRALAERPALTTTATAGRAFARAHLGFDATAAPLVAWCGQPHRAADARGERALSVGLFSEPSAVVHLLEAYLASLSGRQLAFRSTRWLWRRMRRGLNL